MFSSGYRAFTEASDGSLCLAMEYGGEKSLNDLIEERNRDCGSPFPADVILRVALHMARGLKVTMFLYFKQLWCTMKTLNMACTYVAVLLDK